MNYGVPQGEDTISYWSTPIPSFHQYCCYTFKGSFFLWVTQMYYRLGSKHISVSNAQKYLSPETHLAEHVRS